MLPSLLLLAGTTVGYLLPSPEGRYNVTLTTGQLIDYTRNDPFAATPTPRALMLSVFQPVTCASTTPAPYMPNKTAEYQASYLQEAFNMPEEIAAAFTPLFLEAQLPVCSGEAGKQSYEEDTPILLLSPGWGTPRFYYNVIASAIASEGFTVISIDHPEDANIIVYPDGHEVYLNISTGIDGEPDESVYTRAADASFIIDKLSNTTAMAELFPQRGCRPISTDRIGTVGHSMGGATAIIAASRDQRIGAAINWDGTIFGSLPDSGMSQPVLLMMDAVTDIDPTWTAAWQLLKGPKLWVEVANTTHETFADIPTLLKAAGQDTPELADLLGTIAPDELVRILTTSTVAWMNRAFSEKKGDMMSGEKELLESLKDLTVMNGTIPGLDGE